MVTITAPLLPFDLVFQCLMLIGFGAAVGAMTTMVILRSETKKAASLKYLEITPSAIITRSESETSSSCFHCKDNLSREKMLRRDTRSITSFNQLNRTTSTISTCTESSTSSCMHCSKSQLSDSRRNSIASSTSSCMHCSKSHLSDSRRSSLTAIEAAKDRRCRLPPLIILVRHGESECNADHTLWRTKPDNLICLTKKGIRQASVTGRKIEEIFREYDQYDDDEEAEVEDEFFIQGSMLGKSSSLNRTAMNSNALSGNSDDDCNCTKINKPIKRVHLVVSPFERTMQTASALRPWFEHRIVRTDVECRIREQEFGNLQCDKTTLYREEQKKVGRFWYRFPTGESGSDVYDRVKSWWHESVLHINERVGYSPVDAVVVVTHGLTMRFLLMQLYSWSPTTFHSVWNANNCDMYVLKKNLDKPGISPYVLDDTLGDMPKSSIAIALEFKSKKPSESITILLKEYLGIPPPRTHNLEPVKEKIREQYPEIDVLDIETITFMPFIEGGVPQTRRV